MKGPVELALEFEALRERLSRLSRASLRINESLDFDTVLQGVLDSACSLTCARYGVITLPNETGEVEDFLSSRMPSEEALHLWSLRAAQSNSSTHAVWVRPGSPYPRQAENR